MNAMMRAAVLEGKLRCSRKNHAGIQQELSHYLDY